MQIFKEKIVSILSYIGSVLIALARLVVLQFLLFFSALNQILFAKYEVCTVDIRLVPLRCVKKEAENKMSYIDKLCIENPELLDLPDDFSDLDDLDDLDDHGDSNL